MSEVEAGSGAGVGCGCSSGSGSSSSSSSGSGSGLAARAGAPSRSARASSLLSWLKPSMPSTLRPAASAKTCRICAATAAGLKCAVVECAVHDSLASPLVKATLVCLHLPRPLLSTVTTTLSAKQRGCCHTVTARPTIHDSIPTRISPCSRASMHPRHLLRPVLAASIVKHRSLASEGCLTSFGLTSFGLTSGLAARIRLGNGISSSSSSSSLLPSLSSACSFFVAATAAAAAAAAGRPLTRVVRSGFQSGSAR